MSEKGYDKLRSLMMMMMKMMMMMMMMMMIMEPFVTLTQAVEMIKITARKVSLISLPTNKQNLHK